MSPRKAGLGRGLEALIPSEAASVETEFLQLAVDDVVPNPDQPRSRFDEESLEELAASIKEVGVLQPVVVRPGDDAYILIAGERRWRAARRAGLQTIPAVVRGDSADSSLVEALVENIQRQDLTPLEEAHAFKQLLEDYGMTQEKVADRVGKSRPAVANTLRLLQLPGPLQTLVDAGGLSAGHARALLTLDDQKYAIYLGEKAAAEGWSVRQVEDAVRDRKAMESTQPKAKITHLRPAEIIELEKRLEDRLGAKVKINYRNQRGRVEIRFGSLEDLERIYRLMSD
ncbi:MAG: ParB/RepB/Spo0J family partition protein [Acidimicrobiia bacterium]|nr:ParB/RepB/Spo0J family partition protein [Acidimicrobiia bacterium]